MNGSRQANAELIDGILAGMPAVGFCPIADLPSISVPGQMTSRASFLQRSCRLVPRTSRNTRLAHIPVKCRQACSRDIGCEYVIVGHSERRAMMGECSEIVAAKVHGGTLRQPASKPICVSARPWKSARPSDTTAVIDESD